MKGPVWAPPCVFISEGLSELGVRIWRRVFGRGFIENCVREGMCEHFDAKSGAGQGDPGYNWTAAMFFHFARLEGMTG